MTTDVSINHYSLRDMCALTMTQLWALPDGVIVVECDDGKYATTTRRAIYSVLLLRDFYAAYPLAPTSVRHLFQNDRKVGKMSHGSVLDAVMWDIFDYYAAQGTEIDTEHLAAMAYDATNRQYNETSTRLGAYVQSLWILDFIDVIHHPTILEAQNATVATPASIERMYKTLGDVLTNPKELKRNRVADIVKNGVVDRNQVVQCVGPRGYTTDMDSHIFPEPMLVGFTHGFHKFYDTLIDSRLASKASSFTGPPLQATEYFNRQLQLMAHTLNGIVPGDCGSPDTIAWTVRAKDLAALDGKYYQVNTGLMRLSENDRHLIDKTIYLRSALLCHSKDPQKVCQACYGELARSIPRLTNIGHVAATSLGEAISQKVLEVKHVESSSNTNAVQLPEFSRRFIRMSLVNPDQIHLADNMARAKSIKMAISSREARQIADIYQCDDVRALSPAQIAELTEVQFIVEYERGKDVGILQVFMENRPSHLSFTMMQWIKDHGAVPSEDGKFYTIDMTGYSTDEVLFELPRRQVNMLDYAESIKDFLCAAKRKNGGGPTLREFNRVDAALKEFYELISSRMSINLVHMECLLRSTMVRSRSDRDYRIPLAGNAVEFGEFTTMMFMRSMSAALAYQGQKQALERPMVYLNRNRQPHALDWLFVPNVNKISKLHRIRRV